MSNKKIISGILSLIVIAVPFLSTYCLVTYMLNEQLSRFAPRWSDETLYWHQAATFRLVGFEGGYYTVNEQEPPVSCLHFGCHGPVYPIVFGFLGRFLGWELHYTPIINLFFITIAVAWFIIKRKLNPWQLFFIGMLLLVFWPIHIYMITNMRLVIDVSIAIVLASFFCTLISTPNVLSRRSRIGFLLVLLILALYKPTWGFLYLPYWLLIRKQMGLTSFQAIIIALFNIAISFLIYSRIVAPYPFGFVSHFSTVLSYSFLQGIWLFLCHAKVNLGRFFDLSHPPLMLLLRVQMLAAISGSFFIFWRNRKEKTVFRESLFVVISCGMLAIGVICLYDVYGWRDFRLFAPFIFMAGLVFIVYKRIILILFMLVSCLCLYPEFFIIYKTLATKAFPCDHHAITEFTEEITPILQYHSSENAWDNTLLVPWTLLGNNVILGVPPGIGISWFYQPEEIKEVKSKYLLIDKDNAEVLENWASFKYVRTTSIGDLYINQRSCIPSCCQ